MNQEEPEVEKTRLETRLFLPKPFSGWCRRLVWLQKRSAPSRALNAIIRGATSTSGLCRHLKSGSWMGTGAGDKSVWVDPAEHM